MTEITIDPNLVFIQDEGEFPGVSKVSDMVRRDIEAVIGHLPVNKTVDQLDPSAPVSAVIFGTLEKSVLMQELTEQNAIHTETLKGKRECYAFTIVKQPLPGIGKAVVITGSDKRGAIYGLFHLSELLGVSPYINWSGLKPVQRRSVRISDDSTLISKEPSVKYRGIFINDEWPAFGNWANRQFGGINAECYSMIFELLLRLKANYLWPAMWGSSFNLDGPGLKSAELADELGIVMSTSHHEPCMRAGEEYSLVRGPDSVYGDAWDFNANPKGLSRFWEDGLLRNKAFENVITLGMRGEADTPIMKEGTLAENSQLIRDVLKEQNRLISKVMNSKPDEVPRQMVLFTEVEGIFYGDEQTPGLIDDPELDGVTLMLSDNNVGYMSTLPTEEMRSHNGGYGMYYHMDMHGGPFSYQWIGSTYLPKVWDQMSTAYDFGVQEIWVVNVGDVATQELAMTYFLDMAYDMDKYGSAHPNNTETYTQEWLTHNFGGHFSPEQMDLLGKVVQTTYKILERRKHETMNETVYHPTHFNEASALLAEAEAVMDWCATLKEACSPEMSEGFIELIYYPAMGTANLMKTWISTAKNKLYAYQNRVTANDLADEVKRGIDHDRKLTAEFHGAGNGRFDGLGLSQHFGFTQWCEDDNKYPVRRYIEPAQLPRLIVAKTNANEYNIGKHWIGNRMTLSDFLRPDVSEVRLELACGSEMGVSYHIKNEIPWLSFSSDRGWVDKQNDLFVRVDRSQFNGKVTGQFSIESEGAEVVVTVNADDPDYPYPTGTFVEHFGYLAMDADHFVRQHDTDKGQFVGLKPYGRTGVAMKVMPHTADFMDQGESPSLEYSFAVPESGQYELVLYFAPSSPVTHKQEHFIGYQLNDSDLIVENTVRDTSTLFQKSAQRQQESYNNEKTYRTEVSCRQGLNTLKYHQISPNLLLEKIVLLREGHHLPESYLGPDESYRI